MAESEETRAARRALGRQLAGFRRAAGLSQDRLAPRIHYGRSTVANVEVGRQNVPREFWSRCEEVLGAGGVLLEGYAQLQALAAQQRWEAAHREVQALAPLPAWPQQVLATWATATGPRSGHVGLRSRAPDEDLEAVAGAIARAFVRVRPASGRSAIDGPNA